MTQGPVAVLGGTFDPIHHAHLRVGLELLEGLGLDQVRFVPASVPPHRDQPQATPPQRLAMLERALAGQPGFVLDDRELRRRGPSYTVDTLASLRDEFGPRRPLCLVLGADAFAHFHRWHRWRDIPPLAHLLVVHRPGDHPALANPLRELLDRCGRSSPDELWRTGGGGILHRPITQLDISATAIRGLLKTGLSPRYLLPDMVWDYIKQEGLYR